MEDQKVSLIHPNATSKDEVLDIVRNSRACIVIAVDHKDTFKYRQFEECDLNKSEFWALLGYLHAVLPNVDTGI